MSKLHAIDYLAQPDKYPPKPVCVAFGDEMFLRRQVLMRLRHAVLGDDEGDFSLSSYEGRNTEFRDVVEELTTMSMFGGQRLVVVENADDGARTRTPASNEEKPSGAADESADEGGAASSAAIGSSLRTTSPGPAVAACWCWKSRAGQATRSCTRPWMLMDWQSIAARRRTADL